MMSLTIGGPGRWRCPPRSSRPLRPTGCKRCRSARCPARRPSRGHRPICSWTELRGNNHTRYRHTKGRTTARVSHKHQSSGSLAGLGSDELHINSEDYLQRSARTNIYLKVCLKDETVIRTNMKTLHTHMLMQTTQEAQTAT